MNCLFQTDEFILEFNVINIVNKHLQKSLNR